MNRRHFIGIYLYLLIGIFLFLVIYSFRFDALELCHRHNWFDHRIPTQNIQTLIRTLRTTDPSQHKTILDQQLQGYSYNLYQESDGEDIIQGHIDFNNNVITQYTTFYNKNKKYDLYIAAPYTRFYQIYSLIDALICIILLLTISFIVKKGHLIYKISKLYKIPKLIYYERSTLAHKLFITNIMAILASFSCYKVMDMQQALYLSWISEVTPVQENYDTYVKGLEKKLSKYSLNTFNKKKIKKILISTSPNDHCIITVYKTSNSKYYTSINEYLMDLNNKSLLLHFVHYFQYQYKNITVLIYSYPIIVWLNITRYLYIAISFSIYFLLLQAFIKERVRIIKQLQSDVHILQSGNLLHAVQEIGEDELTDLAYQINQMRISYYENTIAEQRAIQANKELITTLSHDIRTPLTTLKGYLEIIHLQKVTPDKRDEYIQRCIIKIDELSELSNRLFEQSLSVSADTSMEIRNISIHVLYAIIKEHIDDIEQKGFIVFPALTKTIGNIQANETLLRRIMDNLFSNIQKYAEISSRIFIASKIEKNEFKLIFENEIRKSTIDTESNHIGLKSVKHSMKLQSGNVYIHQNDNEFIVILSFQIHKK